MAKAQSCKGRKVFLHNFSLCLLWALYLFRSLQLSAFAMDAGFLSLFLFLYFEFSAYSAHSCLLCVECLSLLVKIATRLLRR